MGRQPHLGGKGLPLCGLRQRGSFRNLNPLTDQWAVWFRLLGQLPPRHAALSHPGHLPPSLQIGEIVTRRF
jgi:hypothetical protein